MNFHFFDPGAKVEVTRRNLPHWEQRDAYYFLTWRTADSIPLATLDRWHQERSEWLRQHAIDPDQENWQRDLELLPEAERRQFGRKFTMRWLDMLDQCHGKCVLRDPRFSALVRENLLHQDGQKYALEAFVVMPNHVHVLAGVPGRGEMKKLCRNWKHYTAKEINKSLGLRGQFWQWESFDHLVRSPVSFAKFRRYIINNPAKAHLQKDAARVWVRSSEK